MEERGTFAMWPTYRDYREPLDTGGLLLSRALMGGRDVVADRELCDAFERLGAQASWQLAKLNQVEAMVGEALQTVGRGEQLPPVWRKAIERNHRRVVVLVEVLQELADAFEAAGVVWAAVEGGGVMLATDLSYAAFAAGDFDLLIAEEHWQAAQACCAQCGFHASDRRNRPTQRIEFRRAAPDGSEQWINIGYAPFDRIWVPLAYNDRSAQWLRRRVPAYKVPSLWVLEPSDALAYVAMHTSTHSYIRAPGLRLHVDVDRLVRDCPVDWSWFQQEAFALGVPTRLFVSLVMARGLLGTPVPDGLLESLAPSGPRWAATARLLARDGTVADGRPKLGRREALLLDLLLEDRSLAHWAKRLLLPDDRWLRRHYQTEPEAEEPLWRLHARRWWRGMSRWRPI